MSSEFIFSVKTKGSDIIAVYGVEKGWGRGERSGEYGKSCFVRTFLFCFQCLSMGRWGFILRMSGCA